MATQPKPTDAADAALSAIEEALNLGPAEAMAPDAAGKPTGADKPLKLPEISSDELGAKAPALKMPEPRSADAKSADAKSSETKSAETRPAPVTPAVAPANDDRRSVGQILQAMQVRPSKGPYVAATVVSLVWAGLWFAWAMANRATLLSGDIARLEPALAGLALVGPIAFFFVLAVIARRAQEMRLTARSMSEVAVRLAEPETIATEQVITLSQAIRREVASMGDGIERALARASELETLVRSEVATLERSYADNERRIRTLIDDLSNEREAIVLNAEKVRGAMSGAHENLSDTLATTSLKLAEAVSDAGVRVTQSLGAKGEEISTSLGQTGERLLLGLTWAVSGFPDGAESFLLRQVRARLGLAT